jgi:rRNA maturation protein Rpf1
MSAPPARAAASPRPPGSFKSPPHGPGGASGSRLVQRSVLSASNPIVAGVRNPGFINNAARRGQAFLRFKVARRQAKSDARRARVQTRDAVQRIVVARGKVEREKSEARRAEEKLAAAEEAAAATTAAASPTASDDDDESEGEGEGEDGDREKRAALKKAKAMADKARSRARAAEDALQEAEEAAAAIGVHGEDMSMEELQQMAQRQIPRTIENTRILDDTFLRPEDEEELLGDEADDEFADVFGGAVMPKILITTRPHPSRKLFRVVADLMSIIPNSFFHPRTAPKPKYAAANEAAAAALHAQQERTGTLPSAGAVAGAKGAAAEAEAARKRAAEEEEAERAARPQLPGLVDDVEGAAALAAEEERQRKEAGRLAAEAIVGGPLQELRRRRNTAVRGGPRSMFQMLQLARERKFTHMIMLGERYKKPNWMIVARLPDGPTAFFKLSSYQEVQDFGNEVPLGLLDRPKLTPELILNNFSTRLGRRIGRLVGSLFPHVPDFDKRHVITFHNQRDFVFFRRHQYRFNQADSDSGEDHSSDEDAVISDDTDHDEDAVRDFHEDSDDERKRKNAAVTRKRSWQMVDLKEVYDAERDGTPIGATRLGRKLKPEERREVVQYVARKRRERRLAERRRRILRREGNLPDEEKSNLMVVRTHLAELGPRFTLKLRWLQQGSFDGEFGEYEWYFKRGEIGGALDKHKFSLM